MLSLLFGSVNRERVLLYIGARREGYANEIAKFYKTDLSPIQLQLEKLEIAGILISKSVGKTRVFVYNKRYAFYKEIAALIEKAVQFLPEEEKNKLLLVRKRPRRKGKPI